MPLLLRLNETAAQPLATLNYTKKQLPTISSSQNGIQNQSTELTNSIGGVVMAELDSASVIEPLAGDEIPTASGTQVKKPPPVVPKLYRKPDTRKRKIESTAIVVNTDSNGVWKCPNITSNRNLECSCDMPHTLRCSGDIHSLSVSLTKLYIFGIYFIMFVFAENCHITAPITIRSIPVGLYPKKCNIS